MRQVVLLLVGLAFASSSGIAKEPTKDNAPKDLLTVAELTNYRATAHSAVVTKFIDRVAKQGTHISAFKFGKTHKGQDMVGAVVAWPHITTPEQLKNDKRLVVLVIGNIHSGECCGQEALMRMMRELLLDRDHPWLKDLVLLVVPNYNADANDMRAKNNRPGQIGPVDGMGQRENAQGFDLNRDYMKLESPEARALIGLMNRWNPACFIDCHTTNGSWHRYQLTYDAPHNPAVDDAILALQRDKMMPTITKQLLKKNVDTFYYGNFDKKMTKWITYGHEPRYGLDYYGLRGRLGILSEAYSYITFQERIEATHAFVSACLDYLAKHRPEISKTLQSVEKRARNFNKQDISIAAKLDQYPGKSILKGYDPPWQPRVADKDIVPGVRPTPPGQPKDYPVDFFGKFTPTKTVTRPFAYVIPKKLAKIVAKLRQHGVIVEELKEEIALPAEIYRCTSFKQSPRPFQNHRMARATVEKRQERRTLAKGSYVVRTTQPLCQLIVYLLEPESDDGLVTWNYFDDDLIEGQDFPVIRLPDVVSLPLK